MRHWLGAFHMLHTEDGSFVPVALRMTPGDGANSDADGNEPRSAPRHTTDRYVYEVAVRRAARGDAWVLIAWEIDVPGIQFCDCVDRDEAMALFAEPMKAAGRWHGVRLRPDCRPW